MPSFGTLKADTLTHSTAGSLATNFVVEGTAKMWVHIAMYTPAITDSFNTSSLTDAGTGQGNVTMTNALTSSIRTANCFAGSCVSGRTASFNSTGNTASVVAIQLTNSSGTSQDEDGKGVVWGDLA